MQADDEKGVMVYNEVDNEKASRVRRDALVGVFWRTSLLALFIPVMVAVTLVKFSIGFLVMTVLFGGGVLYFLVSFSRDYLRIKKCLVPLEVYERGVRLPSGSDEEWTNHVPPRFVSFEEIAFFYPNEWNGLSYFVVALRGSDAGRIAVEKALIGDWDRFKKSVEGKMATQEGWVYLIGEGPVYIANVESDMRCLTLRTGAGYRELPWGNVSKYPPEIQPRRLGGLALIRISEADGNAVRILLPLNAARQIVNHFDAYLDSLEESEESEEKKRRLGVL